MKNPIRKFSPVVCDPAAEPSAVQLGGSPHPVPRVGDERRVKRRARRRETAAVSAFVYGLREGRATPRSAA
jgi:hypothetical protein